MSIAHEEPDDTSEDETDDEPGGVSISFFSAPGSDDLPLADPRWNDVLEADELVCRSVWTMFAKRHSIKSERSLIATDALQRKHQERKTTMGEGNNKRGETLARVLEAHRKLEKTSAAEPTAAEIFRHLGPAVAKSVGNVQMAMKRLVGKGELKARPGVSAPRGVVAKKPVRNGGGHPTRKEPIVLSRDAGLEAQATSDPLLAALIKKRDAHANKAATLTLAIEAWDT